MSRSVRFKFTRSIAPEPMPEEDLRVVEELLAKFIARAYRADHPELFQRRAPLHATDAGAELLPARPADQRPPEKPGADAR